jgi:hypothetical protein
MEAVQQAGSNAEGARLVARAWTDDAFKALLLRVRRWLNTMTYESK